MSITNSLLRIFLSPHFTPEQRIEVMTLRPNMDERRDLPDMIACAQRCLVEAHVCMYANEVLERYERAATLKRFIASVRQTYRLALVQYADHTVDDARALDRWADHLFRLDRSRYAPLVEAV